MLSGKADVVDVVAGFCKVCSDTRCFLAEVQLTAKNKKS
jgi:hypothetical protein